MRRALVVALGGALLGILGWWAGSGLELRRVEPGRSITSAMRDAPTGAVIELLPGNHAPFEVDRPVTVVARPGAVVRGPVVVRSDDVRLVGLRVVGGDDGIRVHGVDGVTIEHVTVWGAELHGIEVADASVTLRNCVIGGLGSPYGQGFEVRNANGRPRTVVERCTVSSGQEGLVAHVSRVEFRDNRVSGTTLRAIVVTEMSEGLMEGNEVTDAAGVGLYCGDMSHCELQRNVVQAIAAAPSAGASHAGYGAVAFYHSTVRLRDNHFEDIAAGEPLRLAMDSRETGNFPMSIWPQGWRGLVPGLWISALSLLALGSVRFAVTPWFRRRRRRSAGGPTLSRQAVAVILVAFAVQSFHMLEHWVQVYQVYVIDGENRKGLLGALVDTEWVHFTYNAAVLAFLVSVWVLARRSRGNLAGRLARAAPYLLAALLIQSYHLVEHVAKIVQHLNTGVDPAPGLFGGAVGLVWFHYGINLAVYAGMAVPVAALAAWFLATRPTGGWKRAGTQTVVAGGS
jgi:hypothetical protein